MQNDIETKLLASIAELAERDYTYTVSGYRIEVYLNPETHEVYTFDFVGAGVPIAAWHRRHVWVCTVPDRAIPESVVEVLSNQVGYLAAVCDQYLGSEWDGNNHVGKWAEAPEDPGPPFEFACYWDPAIWFEDSQGEILTMAAAGHAPTDILAKLYLGDQYNGEVEREAALSYVTELVSGHEGALS